MREDSPPNTIFDNFVTPPPGYGEVPFYWWNGEKLTKERLARQLEELKKIKPSGLQVNYAHSDQGGYSYGLTYPSDPPLFSDEWWDLFLWWAEECRKSGIAVSLSDYTLGIVGQGWWMDEIIAEIPDMTGKTLERVSYDTSPSQHLILEVPNQTLAISARSIKDKRQTDGTHQDLTCHLTDDKLDWTAPDSPCVIDIIHVKDNLHSVNPLNPALGPLVIEKYFQRFEDKLPGQAGKTLNFFFSDELDFGVQGKLWINSFPAIFKRMKGYDLVPHLLALFDDVGPITPKIRLDYYDVMVAQMEAAYFKPIFEWHERRDMIYGCDHGSRGQWVMEFGDYFRTQRWVTAPGCDQPNLEANVVKNKVASSIAHLYKRPRVWLEGYYGSGWGTSTEDLTIATQENFVQGQNLLSLHGLYYTLRGGWWEWAPPCNHFRMPYWKHMDKWMLWLRRLSYLMSQGVHRCDVAIIYPVSPAHANMGEKEACDAAFKVGTELFNIGVDFDFIDEESLARCETENGELKVSDETYKVLILPAMRAIKYASMLKILDFFQNGGLVIALDQLPEASDNAGYDDHQLSALNDKLFGEIHDEKSKHSSGGISVLLESADNLSIANLIDTTIQRDFIPSTPCRVNHRKIGSLDIFMITGASKGTTCGFKAHGRVEHWNPWNGAKEEITPITQDHTHTILSLPLEESQARFIVFHSDENHNIKNATQATRRNKSKKLALSGEWDFELLPLLDNRWGDFRLPPSDEIIGPEARFLEYENEKVQLGHGHYFWHLSTIPENTDVIKLEQHLASLRTIASDTPISLNKTQYRWRKYRFSWREGVAGDPGRQGYHGLKDKLSDDFIALGRREIAYTEFTYKPLYSDHEFNYLWTTLYSPSPIKATIQVGGKRPDKTWVAGRLIEHLEQDLSLPEGHTPLLLRYRGAGRGHFVVHENLSELLPPPPSPQATTWFSDSSIVPFDPFAKSITAVYKFISPPGLRKVSGIARARNLSCEVDGVREKTTTVRNHGDQLRFELSLRDDKKTARTVSLIVEQPPGINEGAVFPDPIKMECEKGLIELGDWSRLGVLECYSGAAQYSKTVTISSQQNISDVILDMGRVVASAEVRVNDQLADIKLAPPWTVSIGPFLKCGENRIDIIVHNTLANHYLTIPTRYRGSLESGLIGPVTLTFSPT